MSFFALPGTAVHRRRGVVRSEPSGRAPEADETVPAGDGWETPAVTRWFASTLTSQGSAPRWWTTPWMPTPLRCARLGVRFDALAVPTPVGMRALDSLRMHDPASLGPVADCAAGKSYFLVPAGGASAGHPGPPGLRHLSHDAHLWLPSPDPLREEPVWWLEAPYCAGGGEVHLGDGETLLPVLEAALAATATAA